MLLAVLGRLFGKRTREDATGVPLEQLANEDLMLKFGLGDNAAFEILLKRHEKAVYRYVLRFVSSSSLAEDLVQDIFFRVCKSAQRYTKKAKFTTWLYTIARNLCIDALRRQGGRTELSLNANTSTDDNEQGRSLLDCFAEEKETMASSATLRREFRERLEAALATLPDEQREVFILREFSGLKFREISDVVGVSENTVKSRMRYALEALRGHLATYRGFSFDSDESSDAQHMR